MKSSSYEHLRVPNFSAHALRAVLEEADLDWRSALVRADLDPGAVDRLGGTLPARKDLAFQLEFAALTEGRVDLWLRASRAFTLSSFGVRGLVLATAPTVAAWVEATGTTDYAPSILDISPLRSPSGTVFGIEYTYPDTPEQLIPFSVYRDLVVVARILTLLHGARFPFTRIDFPLAEISPLATAFVDCDVHCGAESLRLQWDPATSTRELPFGDEFQHETWLRADSRVLESLRSTGDWPLTVSRAIRSAPALNRTLANVAVALRVAPRTLQRRLRLAGEDFGRIRDDTLRAIAEEHLAQTDHSIAQISRDLGYSDPAGFTTAFTRWSGMSPSAFRSATIAPPRRARSS